MYYKEICRTTLQVLSLAGSQADPPPATPWTSPVAILDQIQKREAAPHVLSCHADDEAEMSIDGLIRFTADLNLTLGGWNGRDA
jgi:hypothetical protein